MIRRLIILLLIVGCVFGDTIIKSSFGGVLTIKDITFIKVEDSMAIYELNGKELSLDCSKVIQILDDKDFQELPLKEQKTLFKALLDNNQLYIPYAEQEDGKYNLSKEDQRLSNDFYER